MAICGVKHPNKLTQCISSRLYKGVFQLYDEPVMYPWVEAWIPGEKLHLSMGNKSARTQEAHIKSFNFGLSTGLGVKIEVVDEAGGQFFKFFQKINNSNIANVDRLMRYRWGYISQDCEGDLQGYFSGERSSSTFSCKEESRIAAEGGKESTIGLALPDPCYQKYSSEEHMLFIQDIECQANSSTTFKFIVNATDMMAPVMSSVENKTFGSDSNPMHITDAIRELFRPFKIDVEFIEIDTTGTRRPLKFTPIPGTCKSDDRNQLYCGPCGIWHSSARRPIFVAREWLNTVMSSDRRGLITFWEDAKTGSGYAHKLVIARTNKDPCKEINPNLILGTYIVNGGSSSPVLSFQPNFKFMYQQTKTGPTRPTGGTEGPAKDVKQTDGGLNPDCAKTKAMTNLYKAGITSMPSMNPNIWQWFLKDGARWAADSHTVNNYANIFINNIEAELKIQGNPAFEWSYLTTGYALSIVYVNPYRPKDIPIFGDVEWMQGNASSFALTTDTCNEILSNCNWMIMGVSHDIRDGTYHTIIKLRLNAPGVDMPPNATLGGCPGAFKW